jgi:hypothetical protein
VTTRRDLMDTAPPPDDAIEVTMDDFLCGLHKHVSGRSDPLVCDQPTGHDGPHGVTGPSSALYVRWVVR